MDVIDNSHLEKIQEYVASFDGIGQFAFVKNEDNTWTGYITDSEPVFEVSGASFSEAVAKLSNEVYLDQVRHALEVASAAIIKGE